MAQNEIKMSMSLATAKVTTALGNLKNSVANFAKSANEKLGSFIKMAGVGLAGAFTVAAKSAVEYGKEVKNLAQLSNTGVEDFQRLAAAAKTVGIENDKLSDIFKDMNDRVGDFVQTGGGPMMDFFENIGRLVGVTADEFRNLSGPQALQLYYDSLEKANLSQEDMTFYMEAIASDSTALIPLLKDGGKAFKDLGDDAEEAGMVMSESTSSNLSKAQIAIDNFKQKAVIKVGELISGKADFAAFKALGARFGALMAQVGEWMANAFLGAVKHLSAGLIAAVAVVGKNLTQAFQLAALSLKKFIAPVINSLVDNLNKLGFDLDGMNIGQIQADIDAINFNNPLEDWKEFNKDLLDGMGDFKISTKEVQDEWNNLADTYDQMAENEGVVEKQLEARRKAAKQAAIDAAQAAANQKKATEENSKAQEEADKERAAAQAAYNEAKIKQHELELELAEAEGDPNRIAAARESLEIETQIQAMIDRHNISREEATAIVNKQQEQKQRMIDMERDLLNAVLSGDEIAARAAQKKIDLEMRAMEIMEQLKVSYEEAYAIAQKLARIEAGPDKNNSGFTTSFEQREFNRQQKQRDKALDNARRQEERDRRDQGGNIHNVSNERRKTDFAKVNSLIAKDKTARRAENKEIGNMVRGGMDRAEAEAQFSAARAQRARGIEEARAAQKKFGIEDPKAKAKEEADAKAKADWENEFDRVQGKPGGPDGKPGGPDGKQPDPKKPDQAIAEGLQMQAGKLDQQIAILSEISASLKC